MIKCNCSKLQVASGSTAV